MNWVFWVLIVLALICIWFGLTVLFKPIGRLTTKILKDTIEVVTEKEEDKKEN